MTNGIVDYIFPQTLFDREDSHTGPWWTCVRTRPRWEKKFARWLRQKQMPHFLPTYTTTRVSHRKRRMIIEPLFPGYVFVRGACQKRHFTQSSSVVRCLHPRSDHEAGALTRQLVDIWRAAASGLPMVPSPSLASGQQIEIVDGPLRGTVGCFREMGKGGSLDLTVDMLGSGVRVELSPEYRYRVIE